jgi:hypothetical protein
MAMAMRHSFQNFDRLKASGVPEQQARAIIETIEDSAEINLKDLATKADLGLAKTELQAEMAKLRIELKSDINWLKRLFMSGMMLILINIMVTLLHH